MLQGCHKAASGARRGFSTVKRLLSYWCLPLCWSLCSAPSELTQRGLRQALKTRREVTWLACELVATPVSIFSFQRVSEVREERY